MDGLREGARPTLEPAWGAWAAMDTRGRRAKELVWVARKLTTRWGQFQAGRVWGLRCGGGGRDRRENTVESSSVQIRRAERGEAKRIRILGVVVEVARALLSRIGERRRGGIVKGLGNT